MFYRCFLDLGSQDVNWYRNSNPYFRLFLSADPSFWSQISRIKACMQYMQYMQYIEWARASLHLKTRSRLCTYCKCYVLGAPVSAGVCCVLGAKASVFFRYPSEAGPPYRAIHVTWIFSNVWKTYVGHVRKLIHPIRLSFYVFHMSFQSFHRPGIPIGLLERSIKLTNEPPQGLLANLRTWRFRRWDTIWFKSNQHLSSPLEYTNNTE